MKRRVKDILLEVAHDLKHIQKLAIMEANSRAKKREIFRDVAKKVDELYTSELKRKRKDDT